jgi:hypothetical protein
MFQQAHASTSSCFDKLSMTRKKARRGCASCHPEPVEGRRTERTDVSTGLCFDKLMLRQAQHDNKKKSAARVCPLSS